MSQSGRREKCRMRTSYPLGRGQALGIQEGGRLERKFSIRKVLLRPTKTTRRTSTPATKPTKPGRPTRTCQKAAPPHLRLQQKQPRTCTHPHSSRPAVENPKCLRLEARREHAASSWEMQKQRRCSKASHWQHWLSLWEKTTGTRAERPFGVEWGNRRVAARASKTHCETSTLTSYSLFRGDRVCERLTSVCGHSLLAAHSSPRLNTVTLRPETHHHHHGVSDVLGSPFSFFPSHSRDISLYARFLTQQVVPFYRRVLCRLHISMHLTADPQTRRPPHHRFSPLRFYFPASTTTPFSLPPQRLDTSPRTHCQAATQLIPLQCSRRSSNGDTAAHQSSRHRLSTDIHRYWLQLWGCVY